MQDTIFRVFVVALGLITYPREDPMVEEWDNVIPVDIQEHEDKLLWEREKLEQDMTPTSQEDTLEMASTDWEDHYLWYIWNTFSIISMIRFLRKYVRRSSHKKYGDDDISEDSLFSVKSISGEVPLPDSDTLQRFHSKCIKNDKRWREDEFLEGFADDLLEAMRAVTDRNGSMVIEDFQMVKDVCDIIIPFTPPEPYSFQCHLWTNQTCGMTPDMQLCGKIKMVENVKIQNGCPCTSSNAGDDVVCLLHCENDNVKSEITDVYNGLLCMKDTPFLSKSHVTKWFQGTVRDAWAQISHKYEFELNFRNSDAPGALVVRFKSGKTITFNMNPVVKLNSEAYFLITAHSSDMLWTLNVSIYEDRLLHHLSKSLPENSCHIQILEIAYFLHKRQTALTGGSALKNIHFKNTLMHLLLTKAATQWHPDNMACRLRDLLVLVEKSLRQKLLHHFLVGNPSTQKYIELPDALSHAKPVNLFLPLVAHDCLYTNALVHFHEMLKNTCMLIEDYVPSKYSLD
uniref:Inositol 1,4,5-trisphosphate receptor-interacting protein n=1 Tax=Myripristis murdjan TaxID=586833 RepID=A0A667XPF4_9TELE